MDKTYGDCFEFNLLTREMTVINSLPSNPGFMRVRYLANGDFILIGARTFKDFDTIRNEDQELWVLKYGEEEPVPLDHKVSEGVAVSRNSQRIAWANNDQQYPDRFDEGESAIYVADIDYSSGEPVLINQEEIIRGRLPDCQLAPQLLNYYNLIILIKFIRLL